MGLLSLSELLETEIEDSFGNLHYFSNGLLRATFFKKERLTIKSYPDDAGVTILVEYEGPIAVVYNGPLPIDMPFLEWANGLTGFESFWTHCAINGLIFYTDVVLMLGYGQPIFSTAHTSQYDDGDELHELAKQLILHKSGQPWNEEFLLSYQKEQAERFTRNFLD